MKTAISRRVVACFVVGLGLVSGAAVAAAIPGVTFKASSGGDTGCLNRHSYGGIRNDCTYSVEVVGSVVVPEGWHATSINVYGNNSWCQSVSTGGNANSASTVGDATWTLAGPDAWNTLNTGDRYVYWNSTLVFRCSLESGGIIGSAVIN
jgi:hypothetical protein